MEEFYTPKEIQELLKLSKNTAYRLLSQPDFPKLKIGGSIRVPKEEFEKFIKRYIGKDFDLI